jgi:hypothetical protein
MSDQETSNRRGPTERRVRPTSPLSAFRLRGRRTWPRREEERAGAFFVDRFDPLTLAMVVTLLGLTIADGVLTIMLLDVNSEEFNPLLNHMLTRGQTAFLLAKYALTAAGIPFLVVYKHYPIFGTRFRIGWLLPIFVGMYLVLLSYQGALLSVGRPGLPAREPRRSIEIPSSARATDDKPEVVSVSDRR